MLYLTLSAGYTEPSLRDEYEGLLGPGELHLSDALSVRISVWNERYRAIISLDSEQRRAEPIAKLIDELDQEGVELADLVRAEVANCKVRYFSEGRLRHLP